MKLRVGYGFVCGLLLAACASENSRYRDISALEKPPTLVIEKQEAPAENADADKLPADAAATADEEREEAEPKAKKGLGEHAVAISEAPPWELTIRQSFDVAWNLLKRALIQSGIEVTDLEHDQGKFYVAYDADSYVTEHGSLIEKSVGLFSNDYAKQSYLLTVSAEGDATKVTAAPLKDAEYRKRTDRDDEQAPPDSEAANAEASAPSDGAEKLLRSVYLTLRDDLLEN